MAMRSALTFLLLAVFILAGSIPAMQAAVGDGSTTAMAQSADMGPMRCCSGSDDGSAYASSGCVMDCHYLPPIHAVLVHPTPAPLTDPAGYAPHPPLAFGLFRPPIVS